MFSRALCATVLVIFVTFPALSQEKTVAVMPGDEIVVPDFMKTAIKAGNRPDDDKDRDAGRRPGKVMAFFGLERGDTVAKFMASRGYYVGVLSEMVGPNGTVYGHNNSFIAGRITEGTPLGPRVKASGLTNVKAIISDRGTTNSG
jgi:predicted methyltransferase